MLLSVMVSMRLTVLLTYYGNDQYSALQMAFEARRRQRRGPRLRHRDGFWFSIADVCRRDHPVRRSVVARHLPHAAVHHPVAGLADRPAHRGLAHRSRLLPRRGSSTPRSTIPDQRIQQDIDAFTTGTGPGPNNPLLGTSQTLLFGSVNSIVSVVSFVPILWNLSGPLDAVRGDDAQGAVLDRPAVRASWPPSPRSGSDSPLIRLSFRNERTNAAFRYALVRLTGRRRSRSRSTAASGRRAAPWARGSDATSSPTTARSCGARSCCSAGTSR